MSNAPVGGTSRTMKSGWPDSLNVVAVLITAP